MFEKEAKERARKLEESQTLGVYYNEEDYERDRGWNEGEVSGYEEGFKDGAEFGYNKANEWHYVKDGIYPKDMENVIINAFDYGINTCYVAHRLNGKWRSNCSSEIFAFVSAWKEIVLPKEIKGK